MKIFVTAIAIAATLASMGLSQLSHAGATAPYATQGVPGADKPDAAINLDYGVELRKSFEKVDGDLKAGRIDAAFNKLVALAEANQDENDAFAAAMLRIDQVVDKKAPTANIGRAMEITRSDKKVQGLVRFIYDLASRGDAGAMFQMAVVYRLGMAVHPSNDESSAWMVMAADHGHPYAKQLLELIRHAQPAHMRK